MAWRTCILVGLNSLLGANEGYVSSRGLLECFGLLTTIGIVAIVMRAVGRSQVVIGALRQELADMGRRLRQLEQGLHALPDCMGFIDRNGRMLFANKALREVCANGGIQDGYLQIDAWLGEDGQVEFIHQLNEVLDQGRPDSMRRYCCQGSGSSRNWQIAVRAAPLDESDSDSALLIARDVTVENAMETRLANHESFMREAQRLARIGHWARRFDGSEVHWSDAVFDIHERDRASGPLLVFEDYLGLVDPADRDYVRSLYHRVAATGEEIQYQYRLSLPSGKMRMIQMLARGERDAKGRILGIIGTCQDISDRCATEERLRRSEEEARTAAATLQAAVEAMPFAVLVIGSDSRCIMQNTKSRHMHGLAHGRTITEAIGDGDMRAPWVSAQEKVRLGETVHIENTVEPAPGRRVERHIIAPVHSGGTIVGSVWIVLDLTDQRLAERTARETQAKFLAAFRAAPDAILITRLEDDRILEANHGFERVSGWSREEAIGMTMPDLRLWVSQHDASRSHLSLNRPEGYSFEHEARLRMRDGRLRDCLVSARLIHLDGEACIISITRDVSERKRSAEDLRRAHDFTRTILDTVNAMVVVVDGNGLVLRFNRAFIQTTGWSPMEIIGAEWAGMIAPEDRLGFPFRQEMLSAAAKNMVTENHLLRKTGSPLLVAWTHATLCDAKGGVEAFIVSGIDITARSQAAEALIRAERDAVVGRMAGRVAHEVNNPLQAIKAYIDPLKALCVDLPDVSRGLQIIDRQVDRMARLMRSLLGLVRQRQTQRTACRPSDVLVTVSELFRPRFAKAAKTLIVDIPDDLPVAAIDADQVQQLIINLIENALSAIPSGSQTRLRARAEQQWLEIVVEDDGPGLGSDPERLFEPFYTTKFDGTGLGLAVARQICVAHGGGISGENRSPNGARFIVRLRTDLQATQGVPPGEETSGGEVMV